MSRQLDAVKKRVKQIIVKRAINDELPLDVTEWDFDGIFEEAERDTDREKKLDDLSHCALDPGQLLDLLESCEEPDTIVDTMSDCCLFCDDSTDLGNKTVDQFYKHMGW